jgi:hypothetical protein
MEVFFSFMELEGEMTSREGGAAGGGKRKTTSNWSFKEDR